MTMLERQVNECLARHVSKMKKPGKAKTPIRKGVDIDVGMAKVVMLSNHKKESASVMQRVKSLIDILK